ncbi:MAG: (2Fe-2S)-binding protein [Acidimicrobiia bacterium]|nr:(2Fe-2S)-binding protein [Acidimicrobiia bacterium]
MIVELNINDEPRTARVVGWESLLQVLRDELGLAGSKDACEQGECGSCSVILDGELVCSCLVMIGDCQGSRVATVEGVATEGDLHAVQRAMYDAGGVQCGFCTPGFVIAAKHLFEANPSPTAIEIREALSGNICRCTGYGGILRGLETLAAQGGDA